jgi:hypothetical protein
MVKITVNFDMNSQQYEMWIRDEDETRVGVVVLPGPNASILQWHSAAEAIANLVNTLNIPEKP